LGACREICQTEVTIHLDATGSVVKKMDEKRILMYAAIAQSKFKGKPDLPLLEWIVDAHDVTAISFVLFQWQMNVMKLGKIKIKVFVTDFSWGILHSVAAAFLKQTLLEVHNRQWSMCIGKRPKEGLIIRFCCSHFIKNVANRLTKLRLNKEVFDKFN